MEEGSGRIGTTEVAAGEGPQPKVASFEDGGLEPQIKDGGRPLDWKR